MAPRARLALAAAALIATAGLAVAQDQGHDLPAVEPELTAAIAGPDGTSHGEATVAATPSGLMLVRLTLTDLPQGVMGVHIHETGACDDPEFQTAGGHLAGDRDHGIMAGNGPHPGDLPNLHVPESGAITVEYFVPHLTLDLMQDDDGSAIIIHDHADDYSTQPTGDAGGRIACGVFQAAR